MKILIALVWIVALPIGLAAAWFLWQVVAGAIPMPWRWLLLPLAVAALIWQRRWNKAEKSRQAWMRDSGAH